VVLCSKEAPYRWLEGGSDPLRRLDQPSLDKGRGNTLIVPRQMPAHPRLHQVRKGRYLFVLGDLALFVSDELVHKSHETHLHD
jgi:hypothetical protein